MTKWIDVLALDDLAEGEVGTVIVEGAEVAIYRVGAEVFATGNTCTHGQARLCDGFLEGYEIECPLHQGRFDVRSGKAMCPPVDVDIPSFATKIQNGRIWLCLL